MTMTSTTACVLAVLTSVAVWPGCTESETNVSPAADAGDVNASADAADGDLATDNGAATAPPVELTTELCDNPSLMAQLMQTLGGNEGDPGDGPSYGETNIEQFQRMMQAPTEGPFYMVNLIKFRDKAVYADGRETELTGREANALYSPTEFLTAIGARPVFIGEVASVTAGDEGAWDEVAIVEYPCPLALFAMSAHPEFQARSVHKSAGLEKSIVMVTHLQPLPDGTPAASPFPATAQDPAFQHVQVFRYRDQATYGARSNEPTRTGKEAMDLYAAGIRDVELSLGVAPHARLAVEGVFIGDERTWDEVWIDAIPSGAAYTAFSEDATVLEATVHRDAALDEAYGLGVDALIASVPGGGGGSPLPPVTADGTGTLCQSDTDCPGNGVDLCLSQDGASGYCTREGCGAGGCEAPYVCCRACNPAVASMLPFEGAACLPDTMVGQLTAAPVSCTCD